MRLARTFSFCLLAASTCVTAYAQHSSFADSIRKAYKIPELAYAVVSADSVYEIQELGVKKLGTTLAASPTDRFRIGSNTKAITGFIAAQLVQQGKIRWNTKFFDLFPEMKAKARAEYQQLTLLDLLTFRTRLFSYTYTYAQPTKADFTGDEQQQRYQFTQWFFAHEPVHTHDSINFSNLGYVAAGLMLERASGKPYKQLVADLGERMGIQFGFGRPNATDPKQVAGHDAHLRPETTGDDYKLEWLLAAGNINCTLPGYTKFIQLQLQGLQGHSSLLPQSDFNFLHCGRDRFAVGWFPTNDPVYGHYTYNIGNPGTFLSKVYVFKDLNKAFILLANVQSDEADRGIDALYEHLLSHYGSKTQNKH